jgi:hypothetical protein
MATKTSKKKARNPFWNVGDCYYIETVTKYFTGRLVCIDGPELILEDVAWIASTGRFADSMRTHSVSEAEPFPAGQPVLVNRESIVDASLWTGALILVQK